MSNTSVTGNATVRKKALGRAPEEKHFILKDGRKLSTLYELVDELETMSDKAYKEYLAPGVNHFANWVNDVFESEDLAGELKQVEGRIEAKKAVFNHLLKELGKLVNNKGN